MAVQTPKEWEKRECVKTTTAYGNEVMIPRVFISSWEYQRKRYERWKAAGMDSSIGVESLPISMSLSRPTKQMLMVFYEKYRE